MRRTRTLLFVACLVALLAGCAGTANEKQSAVDRMYVLYCGEGTAPDQSRWSPGVTVGKPITLSNSCYAGIWINHDSAQTASLPKAPEYVE